MPDWAALRREFPLLERYVYLNACSLGPLPRAGQAALEAYTRAWLEKGTPAWYSDWLAGAQGPRRRGGPPPLGPPAGGGCSSACGAGWPSSSTRPPGAPPWRPPSRWP